MKLNTLFVVGVCATTLFMSCGSETAQEKQLRLTHTTLVDGDTYQFFQLVGAKVIYEKDYASYVAGVANSSQAKQLAEKSKEVYGSLIPGLDSLAITKQVDFPIKGAEKFVATNNVDTVALQTSISYADDRYIDHVQHEAAVVKDQLQRMTRNTDKDVRTFAEANLAKVTELFTLAGGKEDANAHH